MSTISTLVALLLLSPSGIPPVCSTTTSTETDATSAKVGVLSLTSLRQRRKNENIASQETFKKPSPRPKTKPNDIQVAATTVDKCAPPYEPSRSYNLEQDLDGRSSFSVSSLSFSWYAAGEMVSSEGVNYECRPFPYSDWCSWEEYKPGDDSGLWALAWQVLGACVDCENVQGSGSDGCEEMEKMNEMKVAPTSTTTSSTTSSTTSTTSTTILTTTTTSTTEFRLPCPLAWNNSITYDEGDRVTDHPTGKIYACKKHRAAHCATPAFEVGVGMAFELAWAEVALCVDDQMVENDDSHDMVVHGRTYEVQRQWGPPIYYPIWQLGECRENDADKPIWMDESDMYSSKQKCCEELFDSTSLEDCLGEGFVELNYYGVAPKLEQQETVDGAGEDEGRGSTEAEQTNDPPIYYPSFPHKQCLDLENDGPLPPWLDESQTYSSKRECCEVSFDWIPLEHCLGEEDFHQRDSHEKDTQDQDLWGPPIYYPSFGSLTCRKDDAFKPIWIDESSMYSSKQKCCEETFDWILLEECLGEGFEELNFVGAA